MKHNVYSDNWVPISFYLKREKKNVVSIHFRIQTKSTGICIILDQNIYVLGDITWFRSSFENCDSFPQNLINSLPGMFPLNPLTSYKVVGLQ